MNEEINIAKERYNKWLQEENIKKLERIFASFRLAGNEQCDICKQWVDKIYLIKQEEKFICDVYLTKQLVN